MAKKTPQSELNEAQERAVLTTEGPLLIAAGAGSGKTRVLAHRIAHLIEKGVRPESILAITFTNKAAEEMKRRIFSLIRNSGAGPWVGTFHAFSVMVLREAGRALGLPKSFSILDEEDALSLMKESLKELELDPKQFEPRRMRSLISRRKNEMTGLEKFKAQALEYFPKILAAAWERYEDKKEKAKALDFDDLLLKTVELFSNHHEILEKYQERFRYVHVDEYQDTNLAQYELTRLLAQVRKNICAVGDIDQAIYSWRGADFRNILHFERDWPEAKLITLEENYRSTQSILNAANAVIVKNKFRVPKNLFSRKTSGTRLCAFEAANEEEEAGFIASLAGRLTKNNKIKPQEIAVLYRTNFQSRAIEEKMLELGIPYQVIGIKFYERKEVKDALAYLRAALNPEDLLAAKRIINFPPREIGKVLMTKFFAEDRLQGKEAAKIERFKNILGEIKTAAATKPASVAVRFALSKSGLLEFFDDGTEEGEMRLANIKELASLAGRYDKLSAPEGILKLSEDATLMSAEDGLKNEEESVKLMTVHAAKGLEFKIVFIAGLEEGLFPHKTRLDEEKELREEEERRLFYVALTRAKEKVYLSWAVFRTIFGSRQINRPSPFLSDIPEELLERAPEKIIILE